MQRHIPFAVSALTLLLAAPLAHAQDPVDPVAKPQTVQPQPAPTPAAAPQARQLSWADADTDADGNLSKSEAAAVPGLVDAFDAADSDGNGQLTEDEYRAHRTDAAEVSSPDEEKDEIDPQD